MSGNPNSPRFSLLDRDHSILAFNERVMDWARRPDVPELERLRFLSIVSSNLDEFFEVRMAPQLAAAKAHETRGLYTAQTFEALSAKVHELVARQYAIYNDELLPALEKKGIKIVAHSERNARQRRHVREIFHHEVQPLLMPVGLDPAHPFPQVANKSLNFIVRLTGKDAFGRENEIAIVKVPRILPRFFRLPSMKGSKQIRFVSISSLIRSHLNDLFPGRQVTEFSQFRVTRHSDLAVDEEEVKNLRTALRKGLQQRHYGQALRLEVSAGASEFLSNFLLEQFGLPPACLYRVPGPVNLVRLNQLIDKVDAPELRFEPYLPGWPAQLTPGQSFFERLQQGDVVIHQPYESFDAVLSFLREAVEDPDVLAIKMTIYRTGAKSELMDLLREAVRRGKEVTAVVELKARFDEEANINYAERLESVGAQVVYGVVGLKTHAKMLLITRREPEGLRRYAHLSTGNYNPGTARVYTDLSYLTADEALTADVDQIFLHLASQNRLGRLNKALMAPFLLHKAMLDKLAAARGRGRRAGRGRAHHAQDERADRRAAGARPCRGLTAGRQGRSHRARRLRAAGGGTRFHRQRARAVDHRAHAGAFTGVPLSHGRGGRALALQRRLDEPQHAAPCGAGLARDRRFPAPAHHRRMPQRLSARHPRRLAAAARRTLPAGRAGLRRARARRAAFGAGHPHAPLWQQGMTTCPRAGWT